jgi:hypothetical protein
MLEQPVIVWDLEKLGRLLASQAGRPAPGATGQPDLLGVQLLALGPDEIAEFAALAQEASIGSW